MAERRVSFRVDIDLEKYSKEAHATTVKKIAELIGVKAIELIEERGYSVRRAVVNTELHYVRHQIKKVLKQPRIQRLKSVKSVS